MKELCVRCGKETKYDIGVPITIRRYFIEGAGKLCETCWGKLCPREEEKEIEKHYDNYTIRGDT